MPNEMVDRVARAMREDLGLDWPYAGHEQLLGVARSAITAMREPTGLMVEAIDGFDVYWEYIADGRPNSPNDVWRAMIDAAVRD